MGEVSEQDREVVRSELAWLAEYLRSRGLTIPKIKRFLREMLTVSV